jgi:hypothetical protein
MRFWSGTLSGRLCRVSSLFLENMAEEDNYSLYNKSNRDVHHGNYNPFCKAKTNMQGWSNDKSESETTTKDQI